jgi:hypothetical protein
VAVGTLFVIAVGALSVGLGVTSAVLGHRRIAAPFSFGVCAVCFLAAFAARIASLAAMRGRRRSRQPTRSS